jgi:nucleotide-binding universal stress UspA family protein
MKALGAGRQIAIQNILFATDFSHWSDAALPYALAIAHQYGARLCGAHVIPSDDYLVMAPEVWPAHMEREDKLQEEAVEQLEEQLRGIPHRALAGVGNVWNVLRRMVDEHNIDMIVVGSHGRTGARKLLMGSIAEKIFRQAPCPVLTVGPNVEDQHKSVAEFNQILLATDLGEGSWAAASYAVSFAHEHQARLSLLHVLERPVADTAGTDETSELVFHQLRELVPLDTALLCHPDYFVQFGFPTERILRFATAHHIDLIVMGTHRKHIPVNAITHMAHTTAQHIVAHATCPVLTVSA